eukprot:scpid268/ scgid7863/ Protocadherin Fat 1; Cadherin family member 7; Cadherin-related tumor suppressor homolog; Protein fat homolog; Protocadherin Fat 1, nuclear form
MQQHCGLRGRCTTMDGCGGCISTMRRRNRSSGSNRQVSGAVEELDGRVSRCSRCERKFDLALCTVTVVPYSVLLVTLLCIMVLGQVSPGVAAQQSHAHAHNPAVPYQELAIDIRSQDVQVGKVIATLVNLTDADSLGVLSLCSSHSLHFSTLDDRLTAGTGTQLFAVQTGLLGTVTVQSRVALDAAASRHSPSPHVISLPVLIDLYNVSVASDLPWYCLQRSLIVLRVRVHLPVIPALFSRSEYAGSVYENAPLGTTVSGLLDVRALSSHPLSYTLLPSHAYSDDLVDISITHSSGGYVQLVTKRSHHGLHAYNLTLCAHVIADDNSTLINSTTQIVVTVIGVNDNRPRFSSLTYSLTVSEDTAPGSSLMRVEAFDADSGYDGDLYYHVLESVADSYGMPFALHATTGVLYTANTLDFETQSNWSFNVTVQDRGQPPHHAVAAVHITVTNVNEFWPEVTAEPAAVNVSEEQEPGVLLTTLTVRDRDYRSPGVLNITGVLFQGEATDLVTITRVTGNEAEDGGYITDRFQLRTGSKRLDREQYPDGLIVDAVVVDGAPPQHQLLFPVLVHLQDVNDHYPELDALTVTVSELVPAATQIHIFSATDLDEGNNGDLVFRLDDDQTAFQLGLADRSRVALLTNTSLDREVQSEYTLNLIVADNGTTPQQRNYSISVLVEDDNDNAPTFTQDVFTASISESLQTGSSILMVTAYDKDVGSNSRLRFSVLSQHEKEFFSIDPVSGEVRLRNPVDYELDPRELHAIVQATDLGTPYRQSGSTLVNISVTNVDDTAPLTSMAQYTCTVEENSAGPQPCVRVYATDPDTPQGELTYTLNASNPSGLFAIDGSGTLTVLAALDREVQDTYTVPVTVADGRQHTIANVTVTVTDVNDQFPHLIPFDVSIPDTTPFDTVVARVSVTDSDLAENSLITAFIQHRFDANPSNFPFHLDAESHEVRMATHEQLIPKTYLFSVTVCDNAVIRSKCASPLPHTIRVLPSSPQQPQPEPPAAVPAIVFSQPFYFQVADVNLAAGAVIVTVIAVNTPDASSTLRYSSTMHTCLQVNSSSGEVIVSGASAGSNSSHRNSTAASQGERAPLLTCGGDNQITVTATDIANNRSATVNVTIRVTHNALPQLCSSLSSRPYYTISGRQSSQGIFTGVPRDAVFNLSSYDGSASHQFAIDGNGTIRSVPALASSIEGWYFLVLSISQPSSGLDSNSSVHQNANTTLCSVTIQIQTDACQPRILPHHSTEVWHVATNGTRIIRIGDFHNTSLSNSCLQFSMSGITANSTQFFSVDELTGIVSVASTLPGELQLHHISIDVRHRATKELISMTTVSILIKPAFSLTPQFIADTQSQVVVSTGTPVGQSVARFIATNFDPFTNSTDVLYSIESGVGAGNFSMNPEMGKLQIGSPIPAEFDGEVIQLTIVATSVASIPKSSQITITVTLKLGNHFAPRFTLSAYYVTVSELQTNGSIFQLTAVDDDSSNSHLQSGNNGFDTVNYNCTPASGGQEELITFSPTDGLFSVAGSLQGHVAQYIQVCTAFDLPGDGTASLESEAVQIIIQVSDENDNAPVLELTLTGVQVQADAGVGTAFDVVEASDADAGPNARILYRLAEASTEFAIDAFSGAVAIASSLRDHHQHSGNGSNTRFLHIEAMDLGSPRHYSQQQIIMVTIVNGNFYPTLLQPAIQEFTVSPALSPGSLLGSLNVNDADRLPEQREAVFYLQGFPSQQRQQPFQLDINTGSLSLSAELLPEPRVHYLSIAVRNGGLQSSGRAVVRVRPAEPRYPQCGPTNRTVELDEDFPGGSAILNVRCEPPTADTSFHMTLHGESQGFSVLQNTLTLVSVGHLFHAQQRQHTILLSISESAQLGPQVLSTDITVTIHVRPVSNNRHAPRFLPSDFLAFNLSENTAISTIVGNVQAVDPDSSSLVYFMDHGTAIGHVSVNSTTGQLRVAASLNHETTNGLSAFISATDNGAVPQRSSARVQFRIADENDNAAVFSRGVYHLSVPESDLTPGAHCTLVAVVAVVDADTGRQLVVGLQADGSAAAHTNTGLDLLQIKDTDLYMLVTNNESFVDTRHGNVQTIRIQAYDQAEPQFTSSCFVRITVRETANQHAPTCTGETTTISIYSNFIAETAVSRVIASDADQGANGEFRFLNVTGSGLFHVDPLSGHVRLTSDLRSEQAGTILDTIYIEDVGTPSLIGACTLNVSVILATSITSSRPRLSRTSYFFDASDNATIGTVIGILDPVPSELELPPYHCTLSGEGSGAFVLLPNSATLLAAASLVLNQMFVLTVQCARGGPSSTADVTVHVKNHVAVATFQQPRFNQSLYRFPIPLGTGAGDLIDCVAAYLPNPSSTALSYYFLDAPTKSCLTRFCVDARSGCLNYTSTLRIEPGLAETLTVCASISAIPSDLFDCTQVLVSSPTSNQHQPHFLLPSYTAWVQRNSTVGKTVAYVRAADLDTGSNGKLVYSILATENSDSDTGMLFAINQDTGAVSLQHTLSSTNQSNINLTVFVQDGGEPSLNATTQLRIVLVSAFEQPPRFAQTSYNWSIPENRVAGTVVGQVDATSSSALRYALAEPSAEFVLEVHSGRLVTRTVLDAEVDELDHSLLATATDQQGRITHTQINVRLFDLNDNAPQLTAPSSPVNISIDTPVNTTVARLSATDQDSGPFGKVEFRLLNVDSGLHLYLSVEALSGHIVLQRALVGIAVRRAVMIVAVADGGNPALKSQAMIAINIQDVNHHRPVFPRAEVNVSLPALVPAGFTVATANARDADERSQLLYNIVAGNAAGDFSIDQSSGDIALIVNYNLSSMYSLVVQACDGLHRSDSNLTVHIRFSTQPTVDLMFSEPVFNASVSEAATAGTPVTTLTVSDLLPSTPYLQRRYLFTLLPPQGSFSVDAASGIVRVARSLDRESMPLHIIYVQVQDASELLRVNTAAVSVHLLDSNDNQPVFAAGSYKYTAADTTSLGGQVLQLSATDRDIGSNGVITFHLLSGDPNEHFILEDRTGILRVQRALQSLIVNEFNLLVEARDLGTPSLATQQRLVLTVQDENKPSFRQDSYNISVQEDQDSDSFLLQVGAASPLDNSSIRYTLQSGDPNQFRLDEISGKLFLTGALDFEQERSYSLILRASVPFRGNPHIFDDTLVSIAVEDVNDNRPSFLSQLYTITLDEHNAPGFQIFQLNASDRDSGLAGMTRITMDGAPDIIDFTPGNGSIVLQQELDYENETSYIWTAVVTDLGQPPQESRVPVRLFVRNINDNPPRFLTPQRNISVLESIDVTEIVTTVTAIDDDGRLTPLVFWLVDDSSPGGDQFSVGEETGIVSVNRSNVAQQPVYNLSIGVTDGLFEDYAAITVHVIEENDFTPQFSADLYTSTLLEPVNAGTVIARVNATDGDRGPLGQFVYQILPGHLSDHFSLNASSGELTLTRTLKFDTTRPTTGNTYTVTVTAEDGGGLRGFTSVSLLIEDRNDCTPEFATNTDYVFQLAEGVPIGTLLISSLPTRDCDFGSNARVYYNISTPLPPPSPPGLEFRVDADTGQLTVSRLINGIGKRQFQIQATDLGSPPRFSRIGVCVDVVLAADAPPVLNETLFELKLSEDSDRAGEVVFNVTATTHNPENLPLVYLWDIDTQEELLRILTVFSLDATTGVVTLLSVPQFAFVQEIRGRVKVQDSRGGEALASVLLTILQTERNLRPPTFNSQVFQGEVFENEPVGSSVHLRVPIGAFDTDIGDGGNIVYFLPSSPGDIEFQFNTTTLAVTSLAVFDREQQDTYDFTIAARDNGEPQRFAAPPATVFIQVLDRNDNPPIFSHRLYAGRIAENSVPGTLVNMSRETGRLVVTDEDSNTRLHFNITGGNHNLLTRAPVFRLDSAGNVLLLGDVDFETKSAYVLNVTVSDGVFMDLCHIQITILDENDNLPQFSQQLFQASVQEAQLPGFAVIQVNATDADSHIFGPLTFSLQFASNEFTVDEATGAVRTKAVLNREEQDTYAVILRVEDAGGLSTSVPLSVTITDVNDNTPFFLGAPYRQSITENNGFPGTLLQVIADDMDIGVNARLSYALLDDGNGSFALLDPSVGTVVIIASLDREHIAEHDLVMEVADGGTPQLTARTTIRVSVLDVNDNSPVFQPMSILASVNETAPSSTRIATITATDTDAGAFGTVRYDLLTGNGLFHIDSNSGTVQLTREGVLDFEGQREYSIRVQASDGDLPPRHSSAELIITVLDNNDNRPRFELNSYSARAVENEHPGRVITRITAMDEDSGINSQLTYSLTDALLPFAINATTGEVRTAALLDRELVDTYSVEIIATDAGEIPHSLSGSTYLQVIVDDENDNKPEIVAPDNFTLHATPENDVSGSPIVMLSSQDLDAEGANSLVMYFVNDTDNFKMVGSALVANRPFDFEGRHLYGVHIYGQDTGQPSFETINSVEFTVFVTNVDDLPPTGLHTSAIVTQLGDTTNNNSIACIAVDDRDSQVSTYSYRIHGIEPAGEFFAIRNESQCHLSLAPGPALPPALYNVSVRVADAAGHTLSNASVCVRRVTSGQLDAASVLLVTAKSAEEFARAMSLKADCAGTSTLATFISDLLVAERYVDSAAPAAVKMFSIQDAGQGQLAVSVSSSLQRTLFRDALQRSLDVLSRRLDLQVSGVRSERCSQSACNGAGMFTCREKDTYGQQAAVTLDVGEFTYQSHYHSTSTVCVCHPQHIIQANSNTAGSSSGVCSESIVDACQSNPCLGDSTCIHTASGADGSGVGYRCACNESLTGSNCQVLLRPPVEVDQQCNLFGATECDAMTNSTFTNTSTLILRQFDISQMFAMSVQIRTVASSALLLYSSQLQQEAGGDYIAIFIADGRVTFEMSSNGEVRRAMARGQVDDSQWHLIQLVFMVDRIELTLDGCSSSAAALDPTLCTDSIALSATYRFAHLESPVFIGRIPDKYLRYLHVWQARPSALNNNYLGCLRQLRLGGATTPALNLIENSGPAAGLVLGRNNIRPGCSYLTSACEQGVACGIERCRTNAAPVNCSSIGECSTQYDPVSRFYEPQCLCPVGYVTARQCQQETPRATFTLGTSIRYQLNTATLPALPERSRRQTPAATAAASVAASALYEQVHTTLDAKLRTFALGGLIFKVNSSNSSLTLQLSRGHLLAQMKLGSAAAVHSETPLPINDGTWYTARVARIGTWLSLIVTSDAEPTLRWQASATSSGTDTLLRVDPRSIFVSDQHAGYDGCLTDLRWDGLEIPLIAKRNLHFSVLSNTVGSGSSLTNGGCEIEQCQNNGTLTALTRNGVRAICSCLSGFSGERCEQDVDECSSGPCPAAAVLCQDLVNGYRCVYGNAPLQGNESASDSVSIVLISLLVIVVVISFTAMLLRHYSARKIRRLQHKSMVDHVITNYTATTTVGLPSQDVVRHQDTRGGAAGNVMQYGEEGGGQLDIASVHIDYEQLFRADSADQLEYDYDDDDDGADTMARGNLCASSIPQVLGNRLLDSSSRSTLKVLDTPDIGSGLSHDAKSFIDHSTLSIDKEPAPPPQSGYETLDGEDDELVAVLATGYAYCQPADEVDLYLGRRLQHLIEDDAALDVPIPFEDEGECAEQMSISNWSGADDDILDEISTVSDSSSSGSNYRRRSSDAHTTNSGPMSTDTDLLGDFYDDTLDGGGSVSTATTNVSTLVPLEQRYRLTFMNI